MTSIKYIELYIKKEYTHNHKHKNPTHPTAALYKGGEVYSETSRDLQHRLFGAYMGTFKKANALNKETIMHHSRLKAKGIFLDLDGTIVDSTGAYIEAAQIAFRQLEIQPPQDSLLLEIPRRMEQHLTIDDITKGTTKEFLPIYLNAFRSITERKTRLFPNVSSTLAALSQKAKLALITMRFVPNQVVQKELDYFGILPYFSCVVTGLDTAKPKPSPDALIKCREVLNLDICDCLIAGDSVSDMRAGKAAGAKTVGLLSGLYNREELEREQPDLVLSDVSKLPLHVE